MNVTRKIERQDFAVNTKFDDGYFEIPDGYEDRKAFRDLNPYTVSTAETACLLSTDILIKTNGFAIGAIQEFSYNESPDGTVHGYCSRIVFDKIRIVEAFSGEQHLKQVKPFDIELEYLDCVTTIKNVKITNLHCSMKAGEFVVMENINFLGQDIATEFKE